MQLKNLNIIAVVLLIAYIVNGIIAINSLSITGDEADHFSYAIRFLRGHSEKVAPDDASTMPVSALNALPRGIEQLLHPTLQKTDNGQSDIIYGRYVTLMVCLLIGIYIYRWSKELFGEAGGLFSLFLFVFCPNINSNTVLLTTDAYAALFTLTTAYYFRKFILYSGWRNFILFCIQLGLSQAVKQSLVLLFVFFGILSIAVLLKRDRLFSAYKINVLRFAVLLLVVLFCINLVYLFRGTGKALVDYKFYSETFIRFQQWKLVNRVPLPLPAPLIEGFDQVKYMLNLGSGHLQVSPRSYLFGNYFTGSRWYYYSVVFMFKTPLVTLALLALVLYRILRSKLKGFFGIPYPLAVAFFFLLCMSLLNRSQHSLRHLLMIYPMIYISLGAVLNDRLFKRKVFLVIPVIYMLTGFYYYFPNLISYTNELIFNKKNAYWVLASSNIDYGQGAYFYQRYLKAHPDVRPATAQPGTGVYIIGINDYLDLEGTGKYAWLRKFEPYDHVNHCFLLIRVTEKEMIRKK